MMRMLWIHILGISMMIPPVSAQKIEIVAGGGKLAPPCDAKSLILKEPFYSETDPQGRLVIAEMADGQRILRMDHTARVELLAGTGRKGKPVEGSQNALEASFDGIHNFAIDKKTGDIFIADTWNCVVRKYDAKSKTITTIAGTGQKGFGGDNGNALKADFGGIYCVALDPDDQNLYLADLHNYCIRVVNLKTGFIKRVAGNGNRGKPRDGEIATLEPLVDPRAVSVDRNNNIYILERGGNALRVVNPEGRIRTVVNQSGKKGMNGSNGPALACELNGPKHIQIDSKDRVLIADAENHQILRYDPKMERVERLAGTGKAGTDGLNGRPTDAMLNRPHGVFEMPDNNIIITDSYNNRILKILKAND